MLLIASYSLWPHDGLSTPRRANPFPITHQIPSRAVRCVVSEYFLLLQRRELAKEAPATGAQQRSAGSYRALPYRRELVLEAMLYLALPLKNTTNVEIVFQRVSPSFSCDGGLVRLCQSQPPTVKPRRIPV